MKAKTSLDVDDLARTEERLEILKLANDKGASQGEMEKYYEPIKDSIDEESE